MRVRHLLVRAGAPALALLLLFGSVLYAQEADPSAPVVPVENAAIDAALGSAFTYQGILEEGGSPATGNYDFQFALFNAATGGVQRGSTLARSDVPVTRGAFNVLLDYGDIFGNEQLYLQINVRPSTSSGAFTALAPRQLITAVPQARYAARANSAASLRLPFVGAVNSNQVALRIDNAGGGAAAQLSANTGNATLLLYNNGPGVVLSTTSNPSATTPSVLMYHDGPAGFGAMFEQTHAANPDGALFARARGSGYAARFSYEGTVAGTGLFVQDFSPVQGSYAAVLQGDVAITSSNAPTAPGDLSVAGTLSKAAGAFRIDHPLDPEHQYLQHSFVESPDMMNVYNGNVVLDEHGEAWVELPDWFEALNRDFRYQLTAIGAPGPNLYVAQQVQGNSFRIAGGAPGLLVSWQLTGIRHDPYAEANRIEVEVPKVNEEVGTYLHPTAWGMPASRSLAASMYGAASVPTVRLPAATDAGSAP